MNLLPKCYIERSRERARGSRNAVVITVILCTMVVVSIHSRFVVGTSSDRLLEAQSKADLALELEVDATSLEIRKARFDTFLRRYHAVAPFFPMADLVSTISNLITDTMTLEELSLDIIQIDEGRAVSGRLAGFAVSDDVIASFVNELQNHKLYESVTMDFSRSREVRGIRVRGFRISFLIDLNRNLEFSKSIVVVGDEE